MLKICFESGLYYGSCHIVPGSMTDDLLGLIEGAVFANPENFVRVQYDEIDQEEVERWIPINGGEFYIPPLSHVEDVSDEF